MEAKFRGLQFSNMKRIDSKHCKISKTIFNELIDKLLIKFNLNTTNFKQV